MRALTSIEGMEGDRGWLVALPLFSPHLPNDLNHSITAAEAFLERR